MGKFTIEMDIEAPVHDVFAFFAEPRNFEKLVPEKANFECDELTAGPISLGSKRRIRVDLGGRRIEQVNETVEFVEDHRVVDRQVEGEMPKFEKTQVFEATNTGTKITLIVDYEMPYSVLGKIIDALMAKRQMTAYFQGAYDRGKAIFEESL